MSGFLYINKHIGPTSHDIVDRIRRMTGVKTVGHAGTLDPFASGLLIVGVGREATREFPKLVGLDKRYVATLRLGATSDTDDRTGTIINNSYRVVHSSSFIVHNSMPSENEIQTVLKKFVGKIKQVPPMYSAKKIKGKKLYELAREGKIIDRAPIEIEIFSIGAEPFEARPPNGAAPLRPEVSPRVAFNTIVLNIHCSSGTYIRALARDIGEALGCGAYLEELERTAIGTFSLSEAVKMENLNNDNWKKYLLPPPSVIARSEHNK